MSLRSPPGTGRQWPQLLAYVIDDDDRTRRAGVLLWHLTAALLTVGAMAITVASRIRVVRNVGCTASPRRAQR